MSNIIDLFKRVVWDTTPPPVDKDLLKKIVSRLKEEEYFADASLNVSVPHLCFKKGTITKMVGFTYHYYYPLLELKPVYYLRFSILNKWVEDIFGPVNDVALRWYTGKFIDVPESFTYDRSKPFTDKQYEELRDAVVNCSKHVFSSIKTLEDAYDYVVKPFLNGERSFLLGLGYPEFGMAWIYKYSALAWLVNPSEYWDFKDIVLHAIEVSQNREYPEPNIEHYYGRYEEMFDYLEHYDFSAELKKYEKSLAMLSV